MSWETLQIVLVLALIIVVFFGFVRELMSPDVVAMLAMAALLAVGVLQVDDMLKVFSNPAPITVASLLVITAALEHTGVIERLGRAAARVNWHSPWTALMAMVCVVAAISAFINNTPIVVILTPVMIALAHSLKVAPSRFLIPLSYAAIIGGTCTLIGTSTNIIADGVAQYHGMAGFGMFEITPLGVIMAVISIAYLSIAAPMLLPDRQTIADTLIDLPQKKYLTEVLVAPDSPLIGRTLQEAGLTRTDGLRVVDLLRDDVSFNPEHGQPVLSAGDRVVIRSSAGDVLGLRDGSGFTFPALTQAALSPIANRSVVMMEGIIGPSSRFVGQRVSELNLRRLYGTYVLALHRQNEALHGNFDQLRLEFGDTLLLEGPPEGLKRLFETHQLINLSEVSAERPLRRDKAPIAIAVLAAIMVCAAFEFMPIAGLALIGASLVIALGCIEANEAYRAIDWRMLMLIFGMLGLGRAMEASGAALFVVNAVVAWVDDLGPAVVLSLIYAFTSVMNAFMSNNAAAILFTPIAIGLAQQMGCDPRPFVIAIMFASSADFSTPIGYQTNTFVYTAGGYRFMDFVKIGVPLNVINWLVASLLIPWFWPLN